MRYMIFYREMLQSNRVRHSLRIIVALLFAFFINYFFSFTHQWWLPLATFFVMLTQTGNAFFQGIKQFFILIVLVLLYSWLTYSVDLFYFRISDCILGVIIGIGFNVLLLPDLVDVEFRYIMIPIVKAFADYFAAIVKMLLHMDNVHAEAKKQIVEERLLTLPEWVYETGFDITLQKGHRYFTMKVAELYEILMAMHYLARYPYDKILLDAVREPLLQCLVQVENFFFALLTVLDLRTLAEGVVDFADDITVIEKNFKTIIPLSVEMLDVSKEYIYLAEFIYDLRDFRDAMMRLAQTLR